MPPRSPRSSPVPLPSRPESAASVPKGPSAGPEPAAHPAGIVRLALRQHQDLAPLIDQPLRDNLSAVEVTGNCLWAASDETCQIERLERTGEGLYANHTVFPLSDYFDLPQGSEGEADIEGLCLDGPWLWVTGSMALARKKPRAGESDGTAALERLTRVKRDPNRWLLGRIPCRPSGDGSWALHRTARNDEGREIEAGCLRFTRHGNVLTRALRTDEHIGRFLDVPAKENGFDVEGLAAVTDPASGEARIFLGLRGPVLRGWALILELRARPGKPGRLKLCDIGPEDEPYRKHFLDLDGLGIRDLKILGDDLLILSGPTLDLDGPLILWRWPGALAAAEPDVIPRERLVPTMRLPHGQGVDHAEGIALLPGPDGRKRLLVAYDNPAPHRCHADGAGVDMDLFDLP